MQTHVGPPIRCDAAQSAGWSAASRFPLAFRLLRFMLPLHPPPWLLSRYLGSIRAPQVNTRITPIQPEQGGWLKEVVWSRKSGGTDGAVLRGAVLQKQYDVCNRDWCPCVPTCTAAQLGLYVFARHSEQHFWCVQSRIGQFSSGHQHLQAQRSWSERQLSQQLLPSEKRGRIHVMLRCHNALSRD